MTIIDIVLILICCEAVSMAWLAGERKLRWLKKCRQHNLDPKTGRLLGE